MKKNILAACMLLITSICFAQNNVGIGLTNPDPSALLQLESTTQGFLTTRMTTARRMAIVNPPEGLQVMDTTLHCMYYFSQGWQSMCGGASSTKDTVVIRDTVFLQPAAGCNQIYVDTFIINPDQHRYLYSQPLTALASPGPGKARVLLGMQFHTYAGMPYGSGGQLKVYIGDNCVGFIQCGIFSETGEVTAIMVFNTANMDQRYIDDKPITLRADYDAPTVMLGDRFTKVVIETMIVDL